MIRTGQTIETRSRASGSFSTRPRKRIEAEFEQLIETMFSLAGDGKTSKKGMPNPLRLAVIAKHHFDDVRLPLIPHALQRAALALGAPLGRICGYEPAYGAAEVYELALEPMLAEAA
jgi:hypothetical protein